MKKILSIALVALLAASAVFAAEFSGSASVGFGYDFEGKTYGFSNSKSTKIEIAAEYASATVEQVAEGDIYAGINAAFTITAKASNSGVKFDVDPNAVSSAYVTNGEWTVSILGASASSVDYAVSAIDTYYNAVTKKDAKVTYAAAYNAAPGVTLSYKGWTVGAGFNGKVSGEDYVNDYSVAITTPQFDFDGLKVNVGAAISEKNTPAVDAVEGDWYLDLDPESDTFKEIVQADGTAAVAATKTVAAGASVKVAYAVEDSISATVAADFGIADLKSEKKAWNIDASANISYAPVTVDVYYAAKAIAKQTKIDNLLSAKVAADLSAYEIPVALTVSCKDILGAKAFNAKATANVDALALSAYVGYNIGAKALVVVGGTADYTYAADAFTAKAGVGFNYYSKDAMQLYASASVESSTIVPGATLKLAYAPKADDDGTITSNLLAKQYGAVNASCTIEF